MSLGAHDMGFLKETLHAQQELLQKLYNELDVERESSSVAADEALSMILRLQGEKAAMEMEASQYKRIAEEKMCHAQETVELFQELIYQKEMLIASLEFQVQAYRFKLQSMGVDLEACEMQYPENMLSRRNGSSGETSGQSCLKRGSSLPPLVLDAISKRGSNEGSKSSHSSPKEVRDFKEGDPSFRREHVNGAHNSYWDDMRKLEERVRELANFNNSNDILAPANAKPISDSSPANLPLSTLSICNPSPEVTPKKPDCAGEPTSGDSRCSSSIHDIFEVPHPSPDDSYHDKNLYKSSVEDESKKAKKVESVWDEILKSDVKEKIDWEKKPLLSPISVSDSPKARDTNDKIDGKKRPLLPPCKSTELKSKDMKPHEKHSLFKHPTCGVADFELQQFTRRLKQLEDGRFARRGRDVNVESVNEELKLLREILDKVDKVQVELTNWRPDKTPPKESVGCIKEVMQCFLP